MKKLLLATDVTGVSGLCNTKHKVPPNFFLALTVRTEKWMHSFNIAKTETE